MKRALSFIAATVFTTSVYSQPYTGNSAATDALMEQARQRIYETPLSGAGAAATGQAGSGAGFERTAGPSNSSTGQSNGSNLSGGSSTSSGDGADVTKDSDISGLENPKTSGGREGSAANDSIQKTDAQKQESASGQTKVYNGTDYWRQQKGVGATAGSQSGAVSSDEKQMKKDRDAENAKKALKGEATGDLNQSDAGAVRSSGTAVDSDERARLEREGRSSTETQKLGSASSPKPSE
jgi:hypothetical protein